MNTFQFLRRKREKGSTDTGHGLSALLISQEPQPCGLFHATWQEEEGEKAAKLRPTAEELHRRQAASVRDAGNTSPGLGVSHPWEIT